MYKITLANVKPYQQQKLSLPNGVEMQMILYYRVQQYGWFIQELTFNDFTLREMRICNSPNLLHQYKNQLPFGLACFSKSGREPMLQTDFYDESSTLYILTPDEVTYYGQVLANG